MLAADQHADLNAHHVVRDNGQMTVIDSDAVHAEDAGPDVARISDRF